MIAANAFYVFGTKEETKVTQDLATQLEVKCIKALLRDFACSWILYAIMVSKGTLKFSQETLEEIYVQLIEHPRLKARYLQESFFFIDYLEQQIKTSENPHVQFYLM